MEDDAGCAEGLRGAGVEGMTGETESLPFSVTIKGQIGVKREGDSISLIHKLEAISELRNGEMTLDGMTKLSASLFTDEETVQEWTH